MAIPQWKYADFGLFCFRDSVETAQKKLDAANALLSIRKSVARDLAELRQLHSAGFKNRTHKLSLMRANLATLLDSPEDAYDVLRPFRSACADKSVNKLIIALYTITPTQRDTLHHHGLRMVFSTLLDHLDLTIPPAVRGWLVKVVVKVCETKSNQYSKDLLLATQNHSAYKQHLEGHALGTKKRRRVAPANAKPTEFSPAAIGGIQPLFLDPPPILDDGDLSQPPLPDKQPILKSKRMVFVLREPLVSRIDGITSADVAMHSALTRSSLWLWERLVEEESCRQAGQEQHDELEQQTGQRTDCITAFVPADTTQDITFNIRVGHKAGFKIVRHLAFNCSECVQPSACCDED